MSNWYKTAQKASPQTETPEFKAWFGGSKAVDPDGKPLMLFHGTSRSFAEFQAPNWFGSSKPRSSGTRLMGTRKLFYFTPDPQIASEYAMEIGVAPPKASVMPVYLSIQNPAVIDAKGQLWRDTVSDLKAAYDSGAYDGAIIRNTIDMATSKRSEQISDVYVAFSPTQIKSAIGNIGKFDPKKPDITASATSPIPLELQKLKTPIAAVAQSIVDEWIQDEDGIDEVYGSGGPCDAIAMAMSGILAEAGYEIEEGGWDGDDHAWVLASKNGRTFAVDIPPSTYETGAGYVWKKRKEVAISPEHVEIVEIVERR